MIILKCIYYLKQIENYTGILHLFGICRDNLANISIFNYCFNTSKALMNSKLQNFKTFTQTNLVLNTLIMNGAFSHFDMFVCLGFFKGSNFPHLDRDL